MAASTRNNDVKKFLNNLRFASVLPYLCTVIIIRCMSKAVRIVVHCTGEPADAVRNKAYYRHLFFDVFGWQHWGYHAIVYQDGSWEMLQPLPQPKFGHAHLTYGTMANGAKGYNENSLHIAYVGGLTPHGSRPSDTRTAEQRATLRVLVAKWKHVYGIDEVLGHSQLPNVKKACPCFDARKEYSNV